MAQVVVEGVVDLFERPRVEDDLSSLRREGVVVQQHSDEEQRAQREAEERDDSQDDRAREGGSETHGLSVPARLVRLPLLADLELPGVLRHVEGGQDALVFNVVAHHGWFVEVVLLEESASVLQDAALALDFFSPEVLVLQQHVEQLAVDAVGDGEGSEQEAQKQQREARFYYQESPRTLARLRARDQLLHLREGFIVLVQRLVDCVSQVFESRETGNGEVFLDHFLGNAERWQFSRSELDYLAQFPVEVFEQDR